LVVSIYKSSRDRARVRLWCGERLDAWGVDRDRRELTTSAGITSVVTVGSAPTGGAPSIVLLPGTNMNAAVSLAAATALSADWHTVVLDVPGQPGLSGDWRPRRGRMTWYGNRLGEALERAVPGPALVVGHSLGGAIALACSSSRITGRVLVSPAAADGHPAAVGRCVRLLGEEAEDIGLVTWRDADEPAVLRGEQYAAVPEAGREAAPARTWAYPSIYFSAASRSVVSPPRS
jgi:pimeloyl-ACP methyl ester carboxylesterase